MFQLSDCQWDISRQPKAVLKVGVLKGKYRIIVMDIFLPLTSISLDSITDVQESH